MNLDALRAYCLSLPHTAEKVQWEDHLLFTIGGKMFVITSLEPAPFVATLKPDPEHRLELLETEGVEPAPYLARAGWVSIRGWETLRDSEWRDLVAESYRTIIEKLPKKLQASLSGDNASKTAKQSVSSAKQKAPTRKATANPKTSPEQKTKAKQQTSSVRAKKSSKKGSGAKSVTTAARRKSAAGTTRASKPKSR
jgi:predicted DNA-binding protein (MmcQ/YjbR family)